MSTCLYFAANGGRSDTKPIETAYKRWQEFIDGDKKSWDEIGTWIQGSVNIELSRIWSQ